MNINPISAFCINFKGRVIDYHAHTGNFMGEQFTKDNLDVFVKSPLSNGDTVEKIVVSNIDPFDGTKDEYASNEELYNEIKDDDKYVFMYGCSPKNTSVENVARFMEEYPDAVRGLKFHPNSQGVPITDECYEPYFAFAEENNLPCLFHTVVPTDMGKLVRKEDDTVDTDALDQYSDPQLVYEAAKKYPTVPFVMAHMGSGWRESHDWTLETMLESIENGDANLYCDISWVDIDSEMVDGHKPKDHIIKAIKALKGINNPDWKHGDQSFRLVFGTDAPIARFNEEKGTDHYVDFIDEIKYAIRNDEDLAPDADEIIEDLFYNNAKKLIDMPNQ